jgi:hypothetical protein
MGVSVYVSLVVFSWAYFLYNAFDLSFAFFYYSPAELHVPYIFFLCFLRNRAALR